MVGVHNGGGLILGEPIAQRDLFAHRAAQQILDSLHEDVQVRIARVQRLSSSEGQEALRQRRRARRGDGRRVHVAIQMFDLASRQAPSHQIQRSHDAGEHVVEIVGDPTGQLADGFHLLALAQGCLGPDATGHLRFELGGSFRHLVLERLVTFAQFLHPITKIELPLAAAHGGIDGAQERACAQRTLEKDDVGGHRKETPKLAGRGWRAAAGTRRQHDEGWVRPGRLGAQRRFERPGAGGQGLFGKHDNADLVIQLSRDGSQVRAGLHRVSVTAEHGGRALGIAAIRSADEDAMTFARDPRWHCRGFP